MNTILEGIVVVAVGVLLQANSGWFSGADVVGLVLIVGGAVVAAIGLLRSV